MPNSFSLTQSTIKTIGEVLGDGLIRLTPPYIGGSPRVHNHRFTSVAHPLYGYMELKAQTDFLQPYEEDILLHTHSESFGYTDIWNPESKDLLFFNAIPNPFLNESIPSGCSIVRSILKLGTIEIPEGSNRGQITALLGFKGSASMKTSMIAKCSLMVKLIMTIRNSKGSLKERREMEPIITFNQDGSKTPRFVSDGVRRNLYRQTMDLSFSPGDVIEFDVISIITLSVEAWIIDQPRDETNRPIGEPLYSDGIQGVTSSDLSANFSSFGNPEGEGGIFIPEVRLQLLK
jgi:hypothetical protein